MSSASITTALGLAFLLSRAGRCEVVGLTSVRNKAFVERTGYYARTATYDDLQSAAGGTPAVFVDFAGNGAVVSGVHHALGEWPQ